jgi:hypothetical protein
MRVGRPVVAHRTSPRRIGQHRVCSGAPADAGQGVDHGDLLIGAGVLVVGRDCAGQGRRLAALIRLANRQKAL